jgi:hypothetical protein
MLCAYDLGPIAPVPIESDEGYYVKMIERGTTGRQTGLKVLGRHK